MGHLTYNRTKLRITLYVFSDFPSAGWSIHLIYFPKQSVFTAQIHTNSRNKELHEHDDSSEVAMIRIYAK